MLTKIKPEGNFTGSALPPAEVSRWSFLVHSFYSRTTRKSSPRVMASQEAATAWGIILLCLQSDHRNITWPDHRDGSRDGGEGGRAVKKKKEHKKQLQEMDMFGTYVTTCSRYISQNLLNKQTKLKYHTHLKKTPNQSNKAKPCYLFQLSI